MLINLNYNPEDKVYDYPGVENAIEEIRKHHGDKEAEFFANLKWKDILSKVIDGVYEYWDINEPIFNNIEFNSCEYVEQEIAKDLKFSNYVFMPSNTDKDGKVYVSYKYGIVDNLEQIFKRVSNIKNYIDSNYNFVIFIYPIIKDTEDAKNFNFDKFGEYYGDQDYVADYLYDDNSKIKKVYFFRICRVVERKKRHL